MHKPQLILLSSAIALVLAAAVAAAPVATRLSENPDDIVGPPMAVRGFSPLSVLGSPANLDDGIQLGGDYGRRMQADVTEDNAGNGGGDSDPDDAGWDWVRTSPPDPYEHSATASPTNLYGVCSLGLYYAHLRNPGDAGILQAMTDAAVWSRNAGSGSIRTSADMIFLMLYADLVTDNTFADAAKAKMDARIAAAGTNGTDLAVYIRDLRGVTQNYPNGIIAWDIGAYVVACQMLFDAGYGSPYDTWADQMAEVLWQDSFNDDPGLFDVVDDAGWDPTYTNRNFWWYNLGISGLIDAFETSGVHTAEIPGLVQRILDSQASTGAICFSYGVHADDEDWQSTAYAAMSLARHDKPTYQLDISHMAYYMAATQDPTHGSWLYSGGDHYPEVCLENVSGMYFGEPPTEVLVDDDFVDQDAVDTYNAANSTSYVLGYDAFDNIQDGVNAVSGSTVNVLPGTYEQQVVITTNNLVLAGSGVGSTIIKSPVSLAASFNTGVSNYPVVFINGATGVTIQDLTVDGFGRGNSNYRFIGIAYWNAGGTIQDCRITGIREAPLSGNQHGVGIYSYNNTGGPYALNVLATTVDDYQKNAMALSGDGMVVSVANCTTVGSGDLGLGLPAQNGIQVSYGASGSVSSTSISNMRYTPATWVASGVLVYLPGDAVTLSSLSGANAITNVQAPISWYDGSGSMTDVETVGGSDFGPVYIENASTVSKTAESSPRRSEPLSEERQQSGPPVATSFSVSVSGSCFTGTGVTGTAGVYAYSAGMPLSVLVNNTTLSNWDYGLVADGAAVNLTAQDNSISGNVSAGFDNTLSLAAQDAEYNWWGHVGGPAGGGDLVLGTGVDYTPWRTDGTSTTLCAFTPANTNAVTPGPAPSCISTVNPCVTIPVDIARSDNANLRGFSIQVTLSSELALCGSGISEGTYLSGIGGTNFQVTGSNPYTVDCAILGGTCGATAPTGNLFNLNVTSASPTATGTISITGVTLRDCVNQPIPGSPGTPLSITIDNTPPVAVTNLTATQVKAANDSDGTTKITLNFTVPGDAAVTEVYRAPYGNYPEYDDPTPTPGAVPSAPSYPPAAPWAPTGVTGTGQTDEVAWPARDFWYYAVFTKDACGNVSAVSNMTDGTLNYHLGDVTARLRRRGQCGRLPWTSRSSELTTASPSFPTIHSTTSTSVPPPTTRWMPGRRRTTSSTSRT